ncbi:MAG: hydroxymyristoyl-ACP dehydratase [Bacteroidota bacterium]
MTSTEIISRLPYGPEFQFVDDILEVSEEHIVGTYVFRPDHYFYKSHFIDHPVTPGVILIECCAQIGLVCLGIYLSDDKSQNVAFTNSEMEFYKPVYPGESVSVSSTRIYYRHHKLKCKVLMTNDAGETICRGVLAGMTIQKP